MRKIILFLLVLMVLIMPVMALETLTKDNFDTPETSIKPEKSYYIPGDEVVVSYIITPKTQEDRVLIGGEKGGNARIYTFKTGLKNAVWRYCIGYGSVSSKCESSEGDQIKFGVRYFESESFGKGVRSIEINLTGRVPTVSERLKEINVINISIQEAKNDVYEKIAPLKIKVVNTQKFGEDIQKIRSDANSLKSSFESEGISYNQSEFDQVYSLLNSAQSLVSSGDYLEADEKLKQAEDLLDQSLISQEKSKGFKVKEAESLLSQAENAFNNGEYSKAKSLAEKAKSLAIDIDQDGVANSEDFAPYIHNYLIYAGAAISLVSLYKGTSTYLRRRRRLKEAYEKEKAEVIAMIDEALNRLEWEERTSGGMIR